MSIALAVRLAEIIFAFAYLMQSIEFTVGLRPEKIVGWLRIPLCLLLLGGIAPVFIETVLVLLALGLLYRFNGPYNGGSDRMSMLVLMCLWLSHILPSRHLQELALGYLAFQLVLSYFQSGWVKVINPEWRTGRALQDVFAMTAYPVSEKVRRWASYPTLLFVMSWCVMGFELLFPLALLSKSALCIALAIAMVFHLANASLFGLNRFFWIWPAAYPIIIWFQGRVNFTLPH